MGPDISDVAEFLSTMGKATSVDIDNLINLEEGVFWFVLVAAIALSVLMLAFYVFNTFGIKDRLPESGIMANIKSLSDMMLPILGNMAFLPIIYILIEVYSCTETTGDDIADAFLHKDCF
jgi:hypothetical protein